MRFICFIPLTEIDILVIQSANSMTDEFYLSVGELKDECGDVDYCVLIIDGLVLDDEFGNTWTFDNLSEN